MKLLDNGINVSLSVFKREASSKADVESKLESKGWSKTGEMGSRISYYESSGINLTVMEGVAGTIVVPSGPVRGMLFGNGVNIIGRGDNNSNPNNHVRDTQKASRTIN